MMKRFSNRTLVLMVLALAAFAHFWWRMHGRQSEVRSRKSDAREPPVIRLVPAPTASDAGAPSP